MTGMRIEKHCCAALGLVLWLAVSAGAEVGDRVYPIAYLSDEMLERIDLRDGLVEEWQELLGEPTMTTLDFGSMLDPDPSDLDFRIWLAWHDDPDRFYVAFVASDDEYQNTHDYNVSETSVRSHMDQHDSITLVMDGDHSGGAGCPGNCSVEEWTEIRRRSQKYDAIAHIPDGPTLDDWVTREAMGEFAWMVLPPYGDAGGGVAGENPTISVIELYVTPFDRWAYDDIEGSVTSDLTAGQVIGLGIQVYDTDPAGDPPEFDGFALPWSSDPIEHNVLYWAIFGMQEDGYLDGMLLPPAGAESGEDSAVESVSWPDQGPPGDGVAGVPAVPSSSLRHHPYLGPA